MAAGGHYAGLFTLQASAYLDPRTHSRARRVGT